MMHLKSIALLLTALSSFALQGPKAPRSHELHMIKYSKSFKKVKTTPWGKLFIRNVFYGAPADKPNHLDMAMICRGRKAKALIKNYSHCGLEDVTIDRKNKRVRLHLLDLDHHNGLCLKRRTKYINIPCPSR